MMNNNLSILFFGTPDIAVVVLEQLRKAGLMPEMVITNPDAPVGRKQVLTPPPVAEWAKESGVELFQPESLRDSGALEPITSKQCDLIVVVAYGKIIPAWLLELPKYGILNVHPSLLPEFRGASPIRSAILNDKRETGVTIMLMDEELDHGPIIAQEMLEISDDEWPLDGVVLDKRLAELGGNLLVETIPEWTSGTIDPQEQDHRVATFCTKITKEMSQLEIDPLHLPSGKKAYEMLLKIKAFSGWPETYFMHNEKRIKIKEANLTENGTLEILRVIPEGKNEMSFEEFLKSKT